MHEIKVKVPSRGPQTSRCFSCQRSPEHLVISRWPLEHLVVEAPRTSGCCRRPRKHFCSDCLKHCHCHSMVPCKQPDSKPTSPSSFPRYKESDSNGNDIRCEFVHLFPLIFFFLHPFSCSFSSFSFSFDTVASPGGTRT